jgi:hypothetical protein
MNSDEARRRAENNFKQKARARGGRRAVAEYEAQARATREKIARLKSLRLAKEVQAQTEEPAAGRPAKRNNKRRTETRRD